MLIEPVPSSILFVRLYQASTLPWYVDHLACFTFDTIFHKLNRVTHHMAGLLAAAALYYKLCSLFLSAGNRFLIRISDQMEGMHVRLKVIVVDFKVIILWLCINS